MGRLCKMLVVPSVDLVLDRIKMRKDAEYQRPFLFQCVMIVDTL